MKVFSKNNKGNKSTPLLHELAQHHGLKRLGKPKGITKANPSNSKSKLPFNQLTVNFTTSWKDTIQNDLQKYPKSGRSNFQTSKSIDLQRSVKLGNNSSHRSIPIISSLVNSVEYQHFKTESDNRSSTESIEHIESVLCYGGKAGNQNTITQQNDKYLGQSSLNTKITSFVALGESNKSIPNHNNKISPKQYLTSKQKQNIIANTQMSHNDKQNNKKQINHYKNSKINNHLLKPIERKLSLSFFKIGRKLGRGRFGSVHIAQQKLTGMIFALKLVDLVQVKEEQMESQIMQEIKLQLFMNHPNILKMYGCFRQGNQLCMILQYADQKCLFGRLEEKIGENLVAYYTRQMIEALRYCHSQFILHRDLKPQNILLCRGVAKLADFGWAAYAPKYKRVTFCGTLDYVPPEILKGQYYDQKVDIWSLGVLIYQMATGRAPFESKSINPSHVQTKTMNRIMKGDLVIPFQLSTDLRKLIYSILMTEPQKRPTLEDISGNSWLMNHQEEGLQINKDVWEFWAAIIKR